MNPTKPRIGPWSAIGLIVLVFFALQIVLTSLRAAVTPHLGLNGPRDMVALRAVSSIVLIWSLFAVAWIALKLRGQTLADIGWGKPARIWGWVLALAFGLLFGGAAMMGMAHQGAPVATDWSPWRVVIALGIAISAGICEEGVFRGFVMRQAEDGGAHWSVQILLSALVFGLAHAGWGAMTDHVDMKQMVGAIGATTTLGLMMAISYVAGGRGLLPVIVAHALVDVLAEPWLLLQAVNGGHF